MPQGRLPHLLVGCVGAPRLHDSLLEDAEVRSINCHCVVIAHIVGAQPALELVCSGGGRVCEDRFNAIILFWQTGARQPTSNNFEI